MSHGNSITLLELANIIKSAYKIRYSSEIQVKLNNSDKANRSEITVSNKKLNDLTKYESCNHFVEEANKIWELLEKNAH